MIILWYVMDSLRPDFLSCYGYGKETSPHIEGLAREGVCFTHAIAQATWTRPSGASMLSSTYPSVHGAYGMEDRVPSYVPMVQEQLRRSGFKTLGVSAMGNISPHFGFGRGFDIFVELYKKTSVIEKRRRVIIRNPQWKPHFGNEGDSVPIATSEDINDHLLPLLRDHRDKQLFVFIWSLDTHGPYFHRDMKLAHHHPFDDLKSSEEIQKAASREEIDLLARLYEDMIYYNDHHIGVLIEALKKSKLYDDTWFILTGDHGEAFGEHGVTSHGKVPHDEQIRVPLIMKFPFSRYSGEVSSLAQHIDIAPTLLDYLGIPEDSGLAQGRSLMPSVLDHRKVNDYAYTEYLHREFPSYVSLRTETHKLMAVRRRRMAFREWLKEGRKTWPSPWYVYKPLYLFDLTSDPSEKENIIEKRRDVARQLHSLLKSILRDNTTRGRKLRRNGYDNENPVKEDEGSGDKEVASQLKALGYFD